MHVLRLIARCPLWLLHALGTPMGWLTYWLSPTYRQRFKANVAQAGVPWRQARGAIGAAGRMVTELPYLWMRPQHQPLGGRAQWRNPELIEQAHAGGRGLVLLTPHLGCFEVAAQAYAERFSPRFGPMTALYRPARKAWLRPLMDESRNRPGLKTAPATLAGVRQMIRALRSGETVGLLPDQVPPDGLGVWAPFFGKPAYTMTLASRLVQQTGAALLLLRAERLPNGRGYVIHVSPLAEPLPGADADPAQSAAVINRAMEQLILQSPQQYLWGYHRYKAPRSLPAGDASS
jgi:KDO2-lipid IV(A) lauroyltransferase